jgi:predicted GNAT superfamily acetyltransferase
MDDYKLLPQIQKSAWGFADIDVEPHFLMTRSQKYGGLVQGLYQDGGLLGFTYAILARWQDEYFVYSHMAAIRKEFQGKGYGFLLKKAQREAVIKMGYRTIRWNFDPLESLNAYFNIHRLGVVCSEYERNIYGSGDSGLHRGLDTDRLIATWDLESPRVCERMERKRPRTTVAIPENTREQFADGVGYIELPRDIRRLKVEDMKQAIAWRENTRTLFENAFADNWLLDGFAFSEERDRVFYRLAQTQS